MKFNKNRKSSKTLIGTILSGVLFVGFISILVFLFFTPPTNSDITKVKYTRFLSQLKDGQVKEVVIDKNSDDFSYTLKNSKKTFATTNPQTDDFLEKVLLSNTEVQVKKGDFWNTAASFISPLISVIILLVLLKSLKGAVNPGSESLEIITSDGMKTTFADVAGMREVKKELIDLSNMFNNPAYKKAGAKIPKGILFEGPPGNGKTLLARAFAGESGLRFLSVNASDFGSKFIGASSNKIKNLFRVAKSMAPCVIFIDEIDSIGSKRTVASDAASKEFNTTLAALLTEMDGFISNGQIIVIAATNLADNLDPALLRPGRFDRRIVINPPDKDDRIELFKLYLKNKNISSEIDFNGLSMKTLGLSSSTIECIVNEAVILSVKNGHQEVMQEDLDDAFIHIALKGYIKEDPNRSSNETNLVAIHEAGHAVVGRVLANKHITNIYIKPTTSGFGGFTISNDDNDDLKSLNHYRNELAELLGGRAAEAIILGENNISVGASNDIVQATKLATSFVSCDKCVDYSLFGEIGKEKLLSEVEKLISEAWKSAKQTISHNKDLVIAVADKLKEKETINEEEFLKIVDSFVVE